MRKIMKTRNPLSNTIKDTSTIMHNLLPELYVGREKGGVATLPTTPTGLDGALCREGYA